MLSRLKPRLQGMPASAVGLLGSPVCERPEHPACLLAGIGDAYGEVAGLVLGVQLVAGGGSDEASRAFFA